ncbi:MAG TPA: GDP-mannose 4,6-dehydratase [Thermoanaerobaculia bacterium]|jgi:UDP-glucose 4-epimerase|nr:GDP-mannose 4,6-dehydratase [Thermoanaerobaculia bacterium]
MSPEGFWQGRPVLVTGGCGFIGSHLVEALLAAGARVRVLGRYNSRSDRGFLQGIAREGLEVQLGDVADPWFVRRQAEGVDTIFHLAALIGIPYSYAAPEQYVHTNVRGTLAVLEAARAGSVRRVVHTSTSETYGSAQYVPIDERHPLVAQSPYAATKIAADKLVESYFLSFGLPVTTLRPFNTFGPRQSMRAVIPSLMVQALHGSEIVVGSLSPVRDMNFVLDTVAAFLGIGAAENVAGHVFNVGSGVGRSIGDILELVQEVAGTRKPVRVADERVRPEGSEVERLVCDYSAAAAAFGYAPRHDFRQSLERVRDHLLASATAPDVAVYRV